MIIKLLEEILHFKRESRNMNESDKKVTKSYLISKVKREKLSKKLIKLIENINSF